MKKYKPLNVKIGAFFLILAVLVGVGMGWLIYHVNYSDSEDFSKRQLIKCGRYIDDIVDTEMIDSWLKNGKDDAYIRTENDLKGIQKAFDLSYIFVYRPCFDENGEFTEAVDFVFDLNPPGDTKSIKRNLGDHLDKRKEYKQILEVINTGEAQTTDFWKESKAGELLTALVPLNNDGNNSDDYSIAGVCCKMSLVKETAVRSSIFLVVAVELMIILFAVILLLFIHRRVIRPVKLLSSHMDSFVSNGRMSEDSHIVEINTHDEIEQMADNFNSMADSITQYTIDLREITAVQERLRTELDVAGSIRSAVSAELTYPAFTERSDFELFASMKNTVYNSCSFCNYFLTDENHLTIVIGESVGKSLPSMLMSMLAATHICALAKMHVEPNKIAYEANNSLCGFERNDIGMTVSALIADIDLARGEMKYVNAGMPPVIIKRTGEPYECEAESMQFNLGEMHGVSFEQKILPLNQGMTLFFTSYGIPEMKNTEGEKLTNSRLSQEINNIACQSYPLDEMVDELEMRLETFGSGVQSELDTTILGFRYLG